MINLDTVQINIMGIIERTTKKKKNTNKLLFSKTVKEKSVTYKWFVLKT